MSLLPAASQLLRSGLRTQLQPVVNWSSKPAKHKLSVVDQGIAMAALFGVVLIPSGWILAHLEDYKKKV